MYFVCYFSSDKRKKIRIKDSNRGFCLRNEWWFKMRIDNNIYLILRYFFRNLLYQYSGKIFYFVILRPCIKHFRVYFFSIRWTMQTCTAITVLNCTLYTIYMVMNFFNLKPIKYLAWLDYLENCFAFNVLFSFLLQWIVFIQSNIHLYGVSGYIKMYGNIGINNANIYRDRSQIMMIKLYKLMLKYKI